VSLEFKVFVMRKLILLTFAQIIFITFLFAQSSEPKARKVLEFGRINSGYLYALLDSLAVELQNEPTAEAYAVIYPAKNARPNAAHREGLRIKQYLITNRGVSPDKIKTGNGGSREKMLVELWLVPPGAEVPKITPLEPEKIDLTKTLLFDVQTFPLENDDCTYDVDCPSGEWHLAQLDTFAEQLKVNPNSKAYLIAYAQYCPKCGIEYIYSQSGKLIREKIIVRLDAPTTAKMMLKTDKDYLVKHHKIDDSRIITINGGHNENRNVELWFVPEDGEKPKPKPTTFPPKRSKTAKKKARSK
jgi:hypothetical protein